MEIPRATPSANPVFTDNATPSSTTQPANPQKPLSEETAPTAAPTEISPTSADSTDLSNLTFTATGNLTVRLTSPLDGTSNTASTPIEVATEAGGGVELSVNGQTVSPRQIGKRTIAKKDGETRYTFYGITLEAGPNEIVLVPLGANGSRGTAVHATLFGPGKGITLQTRLMGKLISDGMTAVLLHVQLLDQWGHNAGVGQGVKATILSGDAHLGGYVAAPTATPTPLADPTATAAVPAAPNSVTTATDTQRPGPTALTTPAGLTASSQSKTIEARTAANGSVDIPITPGLKAGTVVIRLETEDGTILQTIRLSVAPYLRTPIVNGLITGGLGSLPGVPGQDLTVANGVNSERARVALFATGQALHDSLITFAYNSADTLDQTIGYGPFTANPDDRPYLTYGDSSVRTDPALSTDHLYARFDYHNASLMWGEFQATTGSQTPGSLGGFDLLVNGLKLEAETDAQHVVLFKATNNVAYARQIFIPTGLSALTTTLHPDIVVSSDIIELVSIDRHSGLILNQTELIQNIDYTLDYGTGDLHFINVPLPFDASFNPQEILVRYEYYATGSDSETTGGRASTTFGKHGAYSAGVGYVNDDQGNGNITLMTQNLSGPALGGKWTIEHASSNGIAGNSLDLTDTSQTLNNNGRGDALRATLTTTLDATKLHLEIQQTSADYNNPFSGLSTPGLFDYRATASRPFADGSLDASLDNERNVGVGYQNSESTATLTIKKKIHKRLALTAGITQRQYAAGSSYVGTGENTQGTGGLATPVPVPTTPPTPTTSNTTSSNPDGSLTQMTLSAAYKLSPAVTATISKLIDIAGNATTTQSDPSETQAEVSVALNKKQKAYIRELWDGTPDQAFANASVPLTNQTSGTHATEFGISSALGNATNVDSEYVIENTGSGSDIYSSIGVQESFAIHKKLKGNISVQRADAVGSGLSGFNIYDGSWSYQPSNALHATGSYQLRTGDEPGSTLSLGTVGQLNPSVSIIGSLQNANTAGYSNNDDRLSLAIRPADNDRSVTLLGYEAQSGTSTTDSDKTNLVSIEHLVRPRRKLEISTRFAYKLDGDSYYAAHSWLLGARADQKIGGPNGRLDLAGELRYLGSANGIVDGNATGYAIESGITVGNSLRFALGFNFAQAPDPALSVAPKRKGIYATFSSVIDSLGAWGRDKY